MEAAMNTDISIYKELLPIIASSITAIATLLGVFIASYFNQKNNKTALEKNLEQEKIKIKLSKIEEIYDHFYNWETYITQKQASHLIYYSGRITEKQFLDSQKTNDSKSAGNSFRKIQSLSDIYFPDASSAFKDVLIYRDAMSKCYFGKQQTQKSCDDLTLAYNAFEKEANKFKDTLALLAKNL